MKNNSGSETTKPYVLQTLSRGADVLNLLFEKDSFSLKEAATELGLNTTVVFRVLRTWVERGYLRYDEDTKRYGAGLMLMRLAAKTHFGAGLPEVQTRLQRVRRRIDQTCSCGVLAGRYVLYVARVLANNTLVYHVEVGKTLPAFATAMGQAMLAFLPRERLEALFPEEELPRHTEQTLVTRAALFEQLDRIREQGYAVNVRQHNPGVSAVAVPVRNEAGEVVAAFSTAGPVDQFPNEEIYGVFLPALLEAAKEPISLRT